MLRRYPILHGPAVWPKSANGVWKGEPWSMVIKEVIDGLIYGCLTAETFGWLWPR